MFRCRDLLSLPTMARARLMAGEKGLDHGIRWSYKAEGMNFATWVHGQELLVVSTPVINSRDFELHTLIEEAIRLKLSGVLLLVGDEYISSISMKTLRLADQNSLPVIALPGDTPLVDFFEELGHAIVYQENRQQANDDILAGIVFGNQIDVALLNRQAKAYGYRIAGKQRGFMIHMVVPEEIATSSCITECVEILQSLFREHGVMAIISHFYSNLLGITGESSEAKLNEVFEEFCEYVANWEDGTGCLIGVGCAYEELTMLSQSFTEASTVMNLGNTIQWYEKLGFLQLLLTTENQKQLSAYVEQILGNIIAHDRENKSELLNTLIAYFDCNENMREAAVKIFVHPNTVKYRLQQIQEITKMGLSVMQDKMELYNAILIWKIVENGKYSLKRL